MSDNPPSGLPDSSAATVKKRKIASTGQKESACWNSFDKIELPEAKQKSLQRNFDGKCLACGTVVTGKPLNLNRHLSTCKELGLSDQLTALTNAASKGGGTASSAGAAENAQAGTASGASTSNQQKRLNSPMKKYLDKAAIGPHEMRRLQLMLALCFVCQWIWSAPRKHWICFQSTMMMTVQRLEACSSTTPAFRLAMGSTLPTLTQC